MAATLVVASVVIAVTAVAIRNPRAATVEGTALDTAATAIAGAVGSFFTALAGIKFSAAALAAGALATITGLARRKDSCLPRVVTGGCRIRAPRGLASAGKMPMEMCGCRPGRVLSPMVDPTGTCKAKTARIMTMFIQEANGDERH
nr:MULTISPECIES: hypothetical protein [Nocardia]